MRAFPLTVLRGGISRYKTKGGASADTLYDLQNGFITVDGSVSPREGTIRTATLDSSTAGLMAADGIFNVFSSAFSSATLPAGYQLNVLSDPNDRTQPIETIWFAKPFMGFPYVVAEFANGDIEHFWLQNDGTWTSSTVYTSASVVLPPTPNGLAYRGVRNFPQQPNWTPETIITSGTYVEPTAATGFAYQAVAVAGSPAHTGAVEPSWPTTAGGILQEFGDFDVSTSDAGTTQGSGTVSTNTPLGSTITDRYGDSSTIANSGTPVNSSTITTALASTKVNTWTAGTNYAPGAVVIPTTGQGAFVNAIPNGDFEGVTDWTFTDPGGITQWAFSSTLPYQGAGCITFPGGGAATPGAGGAFATMTSYSLVTPGQSVTATAYLNPNNSGANLTLWIQLNWYNAADSIISSSGHAQNEQEGGGYRLTSITATAPAGAAHCRVSIGAGSGTTSRNAGFADLVSWNLATAAPITNFLFEAIQPTAATSSATEPTWPTVLGNTVIDGGVTWKAIGTSIITWQAIPLMFSGLTAPTFPTTIGLSVHDFSTYSNVNGFITSQTSMSWEAIDRSISDPKNPHTTAVAIGASHVFAGDNDIVDFSAAVDPTDWSSPNNAGYLPTGLNNYGDNPVAMLALYRSNLVAFNAGGYQMWQIDPDPQNMALLDAQPVGSIYQRAAQSVANDLLFLTEVGVRNLATLGATANMAIGNTGQPVDPLIKAQLSGVTITSGGTDPFFSNVGLLVPPLNGFNDVSANALVATVAGTGVATSASSPFATGDSVSFTGGGFGGSLQYPEVSGGPIDLSGGTWTVEFWLNAPRASFSQGGVVEIHGTPPMLRVLFQNDATGQHLGVNVNGSLGATPDGSIPASTWVAVAIVSTAFSAQVFLNGVASGSPISYSNSAHTTDTLYVGNIFDGSIPLFGSISNLRITKGIARYSGNYTPTTSPFPTQVFFLYDPISCYYPGRGQYMLFFGPQAFVLTINGNSQKSWSRYIFPDTVTDMTINAGILYFRTAGDLVWKYDAAAIGVDDANTIISSATNTTWSGVMQWPFLDVGSMGLNKMLVGVDLIADGDCYIQVAHNQTDKTGFVDNPSFALSTSVTAPYFVSVDDTLPGEPLPIPINAASYSLILTFPGNATTANAWGWNAANIYLTNQGGGGATG